jgi:hypothetical protein
VDRIRINKTRAKESKTFRGIASLMDKCGQYNDLIVAETMFLDIVQRKQKVWFVLGWIANEKKYILQQIEQHLVTFSKMDTFWS